MGVGVGSTQQFREKLMPSPAGFNHHLNLEEGGGMLRKASPKSQHMVILQAQKRLQSVLDKCTTAFLGSNKIPSMQKLSGCSCFPLHNIFSNNKLLRSSTSAQKRRPIADCSSYSSESNINTCPSGKGTEQILLRIRVIGSPNRTLLLLAPVNATAEAVIEMLLDTYEHHRHHYATHNFDLFCAHCNSPALHPKQQIGSVGSKHFVLSRRTPAFTGL